MRWKTILAAVVVLKGEQHFSNGYALDQLVNIMGAAPSNRYFLLSMAVAF